MFTVNKTPRNVRCEASLEGMSSVVVPERGAHGPWPGRAIAAAGRLAARWSRPTARAVRKEPTFYRVERRFGKGGV